MKNDHLEKFNLLYSRGQRDPPKQQWNGAHLCTLVMDSHRGNNNKKQRLDRRIVNQLARSVGRRGIDRLLCRLLFNRVQLLLGHCLPPLHLLYSCLVTYSDSFTGRAATLKNWSRHQTNWLWFMESSTARGRVRASYRQAGRQCTTTTRSSSLSPTSKRFLFRRRSLWPPKEMSIVHNKHTRGFVYPWLYRHRRVVANHNTSWGWQKQHNWSCGPGTMGLGSWIELRTKVYIVAHTVQ